MKRKRKSIAWVGHVLWGLAALFVCAVVVIRFEVLLQRVNWSLLVLIALLGLGAFMLHRWNTAGDNDYNVVDLITTNGRADLYKHLIVFFAGVAAWVIARVTLSSQPVESLLLGVLGIFVGKVAIDGIAGAIKGRAPSPSAATEVSVTQIATSTEKKDD